MIPANANGASQSARPVIFQARSSAERYAIRTAQAFSREGLATGVEYVDGAFTPKGGGRCFAIVPAPMGEWQVVELPASEVTRRQQAGMRFAIDRHLAKAREHDASAMASRMGSVRGFHHQLAREERAVARVLELRLVVGAVRAAEPYYSSERDNREASSL